MPAERTAQKKDKASLIQLTLTGKPAPATTSTTSKTSSKKSSGPERAYTDALLAIKPEFVTLIEKREKNHEYRKYQLRPTTVRLWVYTTAPNSAITHVIETARPKRPGEVKDSSGVGNDDFDAGKKQSKFGYPVLGLYKLQKPLGPNELKAYGVTPPQGYMYMPKKIIDDLPIESMTKLF